MDKHRTAWQSCLYKVRLAAGGRIVIPAEVRQLLRIQVGEELLLTLDEVGFRVTTYRQAIRQAQSLLAKQPSEDGRGIQHRQVALTPLRIAL